MQEIIQFMGLSFIECLLMILILSYLGIHVLERDIIFIDIALAQVSVVGAIAAFVLFKVEYHSFLSYVSAFGFTLLAAAFYSFVHRRIRQISLETIIGVSYAIAAAAALFLLATSAGGHSHIQQMLTGSILWVRWSDIILSAIVFTVVGILFYIFRETFRKISISYHRSDLEAGSEWWDFLFYMLLGIVIIVSVRIAGLLVVFAFLIIPGVISAMFSSKFGIRLLIAWFVGAIVLVLGLIFSYRFDFSVGPSIVMFLGIALIFISMVKKLNTMKERRLNKKN